MRHATGLFMLLMLAGAPPALTAQELRSGARATSAILTEIKTAFESADVDALIEHSAERLDLTLFNNAKLLSRSQAKYVLIDFFRRYRPVRLTLAEASGAEGNWFASGTYWFENGQDPLSVYVRLRSNDGDQVLREIRIAGRIPE